MLLINLEQARRMAWELLTLEQSAGPEDRLASSAAGSSSINWYRELYGSPNPIAPGEASPDQLL